MTIHEQTIDTLRYLAADAVQKANSGHPGAPMGAAPMAYVLWNEFLRHDPKHPLWPNRDRFVLSAGHASMLLYGLLHLTGYDMSLEDIKNFRQWGSKTPGHPEHDAAPGIEATTGPLGQGLGNAVGMAVAERHLAAVYNRPGHEIIDHHTYVLASDGDMQEGVASEASSLAGHLGLGKLIVLYDSNQVQLAGPTHQSFTEDVGARFTAYGWHVQGPIDGFDLQAVRQAIAAAQAETERPSLIICRTIIGFPSPKQGTYKVHGEPLGEEALEASKRESGWPLSPRFLVPDQVAAHMGKAVERGATWRTEWMERMAAYELAFPKEAAALYGALEGTLPDGWDEDVERLFAEPDTEDDKPQAMATRNASGEVINLLAGRIPALLGGSADLAPSTKTLISDTDDFEKATPQGRNMRFGVREHAMGAMANGMALHGGVIPYTATFLTFSDYMRPAMRLAALTRLRVVHVFTHDSIGLGEDGPTHQPVEQVAALRAIPNLTLIRPADASETAQAWLAALRKTDGPTSLILTRQKLPMLDRGVYAPAEGLHYGAYVLWQTSETEPQVILMASGSEVQHVLEAGQQLAADGVAVRVVSFPSWELFAAQPREYRDEILPPDCWRRVAMEAGVAMGWDRWVGPRGRIISVERFGASAPGKIVFEKYGITSGHALAEARELLSQED